MFLNILRVKRNRKKGLKKLDKRGKKGLKKLGRKSLKVWPLEGRMV